MRNYIEQLWSGKRKAYLLLLPLSLLFAGITALRRQLYRWRCLPRYSAPIPVIVVGNITVGGSGKTPFVIWLVEQLTAKGWRVGVISRGYGSQQTQFPYLITSKTTALQGGDEPVLIFRRTGAPVAIARKRIDAATCLLSHHSLDLIITDDGLQHYALERDMEIAIVDGQRLFGNGWWLPAGPLRESRARLAMLDAVVVNGGTQGPFPYPSIPMTLAPSEAVNLVTQQRVPVAALSPAVAMAGIGYPPRFFNTLSECGLVPERCYEFADHAPYTLTMLDRLTDSNQQLIMTEKDAVKCMDFAQKNWWYLPISASIPEQYAADLFEKIDTIYHKNRNLSKVNL